MDGEAGDLDEGLVGDVVELGGGGEQVFDVLDLVDVLGVGQRLAGRVRVRLLGRGCDVVLEFGLSLGRVAADVAVGAGVLVRRPKLELDLALARVIALAHRVAGRPQRAAALGVVEEDVAVLVGREVAVDGAVEAVGLQGRLEARQERARRVAGGLLEQLGLQEHFVLAAADLGGGGGGDLRSGEERQDGINDLDHVGD